MLSLNALVSLRIGEDGIDYPSRIEDLAADTVIVAAPVGANAALFDPSHHFHGCIPGIHEILRRQGLLEGRWCLDPNEDLSPGQEQEIDRVCKDYPDLQDDEFVRSHLDAWLS